MGLIYKPEWPSKTDCPIGIRGAGGIVNDAHLPAYRKAGFRIESIYDVDQSCAEETAVRFDIPHVCNSLASLAERVGFGCVPGSHKSNYCFSGGWRDMAENIELYVRRVTGLAGTAVIFTEALTHGALPWTGQVERRKIFLSIARIRCRGLRATSMGRSSKV